MTRPLLPLFASTCLMLAVTTTAQAEGLYAAIAISPSTGIAGTATNFETETLAETEAYQQCGSEDCDTALVFQQCGAIAVGQGHGWGAASDLSSATAIDNALDICGENDSGCEITAAFCNEGY